MSSTPSLQQRIADLDLRRRMAWGLIGGRSKAAIAEAEGLSLTECQAILEQPGTYVLFNVWSLFLWHQQRGGWKHLLAVVRWAMNCVLYHAKSCAFGEGVGRCMVIATVFSLSVAGPLRSLVNQLYGIAGRSGKPTPRLGPVRRKLVEIMAWGVETALQEKLFEHAGIEVLYALDARFRAAMARGEIACFDMTPPGAAEVDAARIALDAAWQAHIIGVDQGATAAEATTAAEARASIETQIAPAAAKPVAHAATLVPLASDPDAASVDRPPPHPPPILDVARLACRRQPLPPLVRPRPIERAA